MRNENHTKHSSLLPQLLRSFENGSAAGRHATSRAPPAPLPPQSNLHLLFKRTIHKKGTSSGVQRLVRRDSRQFQREDSERGHTARSLPTCSAGSSRTPGRTPWRRSLSVPVGATHTSLALVPFFCPRGAAYGCALWCAAAARATATLSCSCRQATLHRSLTPPPSGTRSAFAMRPHGTRARGL